MIESEAIEKNLTTVLVGRPTYFLQSTGSTNDFIKEHAAEMPQGAAVYTMRQKSGKGRRGKTWDDGEGKSVALSVLIKGVAARAIAELPLYCGMAVLDALEQLTGQACALKWPNDVIMKGRKVVGILCEGFTQDGELAAVMGMGVNLYQSDTDFMRAGLPHAGSLLTLTGRKYEPEQVVSAILNKLEGVILTCETGGFSAIRARFERKCINIGREVRVQYENGERAGIAIGIGADGALLVDSNGETVTVRSGEASVRGLFGYSE